MALQLKFLLQLDVSGDFIYLTDTTGEYDATQNDTGWGTPNPNINQSCLIARIVRRAENPETLESEDTPLIPVITDLIFNPGALNDQETQFQFAFVRDGHHVAWFFRLPVSNDGVLTLEGLTLQEGEYFYWDTNSAVYQIVGGSPVLVEDYAVMIDDPTVVQSTCQEIYMPLLIEKKNDLYRDYKDERSGSCNDDDTFRQMVMLREDIQGADYTFRSGLTTQAETQVDNLLEEYNL